MAEATQVRILVTAALCADMAELNFSPSYAIGHLKSWVAEWPFLSVRILVVVDTFVVKKWSSSVVTTQS